MTTATQRHAPSAVEERTWGGPGYVMWRDRAFVPKRTPECRKLYPDANGDRVVHHHHLCPTSSPCGCPCHAMREKKENSDA